MTPAADPLAPNARAVGRSLRIYHAPGRAPLLDAFYRRFLAPGDLAFDIGAHAGDRTASFCRLGARVVAVEPQPAMARLLARLFARTPQITRIPALVGASPGHAPLFVNARNPTISTASQAFIAATDGAPGWQGQAWDHEISRPVTTLDALAATHGRPDFIKIDVEGYEAEALRGLSFAPRALSFEFTTIQRALAGECLALLSILGYRAFNASLGESLEFTHPAPIGADAMARFLNALPHAANSGDIYASNEVGRLSQGKR